MKKKSIVLGLLTGIGLLILISHTPILLLSLRILFNPNDVILYSQRGEIKLYAESDYDGAVSDFTKSIELISKLDQDSSKELSESGIELGNLYNHRAAAYRNLGLRNELSKHIKESIFFYKLSLNDYRKSASIYQSNGNKAIYIFQSNNAKQISEHLSSLKIRQKNETTTP